jgi:hypothetical protein
MIDLLNNQNEAADKIGGLKMVRGNIADPDGNELGFMY